MDDKTIDNTQEVSPNEEKTAEKQHRVPGRPFPKGTSGNLNGRPLGAENFKTKFYRALDKLAQKEGKTVTELEEELFQIGYLRARKDYAFYRDLQDRVYGKPMQHIDHTTKGKEMIMSPEHKALADKAIDDILNDESQASN